MQRRKSKRHVIAADARWRAAEARAERERAEGIPDRQAMIDQRAPITLDLTSYGGPLLHIEPRPGHIAVRAIDDATGDRTVCALKTLLHRVADGLPRVASPRSLA